MTERPLVRGPFTILQHGLLTGVGVAGLLDASLEEVQHALECNTSFEVGIQGMNGSASLAFAALGRAYHEVKVASHDSGATHVIGYGLDTAPVQAHIRQMFDMIPFHPDRNRPTDDLLKVLQEQLTTERARYEACRITARAREESAEDHFRVGSYAEFLNNYRGVTLDEARRIAHDRFSEREPAYA